MWKCSRWGWWITTTNIFGDREASAVPAGTGFFYLCGFRWFPLADSLHHRLISAVPPGQFASTTFNRITCDEELDSHIIGSYSVLLNNMARKIQTLEWD